ncbi:MAG: ATP-binding protein [Spirochaetia bacterium]|nr:ATP-binding protein [Spirochaetia bacterium]
MVEPIINDPKSPKTKKRVISQKNKDDFSLIKVSPLPHIVVDKDLEIIFANSEALRMFPELAEKKLKTLSNIIDSQALLVFKDRIKYVFEKNDTTLIRDYQFIDKKNSIYKIKYNLFISAHTKEKYLICGINCLDQEYAAIREMAKSLKETNERISAEENFRTIFNNSPVGIGIINLGNNKIFQCNEIFRNIIGEDNNNDILLSDLFQKLTFTSKKDFIKYFIRNENADFSDSIKFNMKMKSGIIKYTSFYFKKIQIHNSENMLLYSIDITKEKIFENKNRFFEFKFKTMLSNLNDNMLFLINRDFVCLASGGGFAFGATKQNMNYETTEMENKTIHEILPEEILDQIWPGYKDVFNGIELNRQIEYRGLNYEVRCIPVHDDRHFVIAGLVAVRDVTNIVKTYQKLISSEEKYRRLVEASPDILYRFSQAKGGIYYSSKAEDILGYSLSEFYEKPYLWVESVHPEDKKTVTMAIADIKTGIRYDIEYRIKTSKGNYLWFRDRCIEILIGDDGIISEGIATDITARKKIEIELKRQTIDLKESYNELEQFSYIIAHDLQEPVRMVANYIGLISKKIEYDIDEKLKKYFNYTVDGSVRIQEMIFSMLEFSRAGANKLTFDMVDLNDIAQTAVVNMKLLISETKASVVFENLPILKGDKSQLIRVFMNLISNSIRFMPKNQKGKYVRNPQIRIFSAKKDKRYFFISIQDNGMGIPKESVNSIFDIFRRAHSRETYPGTGMGLTICKKIIKRHKGDIKVLTTSSKGTTMQIRLPRGS